MPKAKPINVKVMGYDRLLKLQARVDAEVNARVDKQIEATQAELDRLKGLKKAVVAKEK